MKSATRKQTGVVLIVAMVMLVVIGLASVAIMRNALGTDVISDNNRLQAQALQMAQAALHYCEGRVLKTDANQLVPQAAAATQVQEDWRTFNNWSGAHKATYVQDVPTAYLSTSDVSKTRPSGWKQPQCMAQSRAITAGFKTAVITARGFSDNYRAKTNGQSETGSEVWLQSIIQYQ
jgi:Tfp pilus assembly protein PilX